MGTTRSSTKKLTPPQRERGLLLPSSWTSSLFSWHLPASLPLRPNSLSMPTTPGSQLLQSAPLLLTVSRAKLQPADPTSRDKPTPGTAPAIADCAIFVDSPILATLPNAAVSALLESPSVPRSAKKAEPSAWPVEFSKKNSLLFKKRKM